MCDTQEGEVCAFLVMFPSQRFDSSMFSSPFPTLVFGAKWQDWLFAMGVADGVDGGCVCKGGTTNSVGSADVVSNGNPISRGPAAGGGGGSGAEATTPIAVASAGPGARMGTPPPVALPPPRPTSPAAALTEWLTSLGLGCYEERLVSQGFDTLEAMGTATEADLEAMGFLKGHLRLLLARASSDALSSGGKAPSNGSGGTVATVTAAAEAANSGNVAAADSSVDAERSTRASGGIKLDESMHDSGAVGIAPSGAAGANASPMAWTSVVNGEHTSTPEQHGKGAKGLDHDDSNNGEQQDEDEEGMYCDAQALNPMRMLPGYGSSTDGLNGAGNGGRGDEFKELKPEEVQVDEVIGEGSFGIVRRARWRGMYVAVKELKVSIAYAAAAASSNGSADSGVAAAGVTAAAALAIDDGNRNRSSSTDGEEEMRHEARMLAKVCNHVW